MISTSFSGARLSSSLFRKLVKGVFPCLIALGTFMACEANAETAVNYTCVGGSPFRLSGTIDFKACTGADGTEYLCPKGTTVGTGGFVNIGRLGSYDISLGALLAPEESPEAPVEICQLAIVKSGQGQYQMAHVGGWGNCALVTKSGNTFYLQSDASTADLNGLQCRLTFKRG